MSTANNTVIAIADRSTPKPSLNRTRQYVEMRAWLKAQEEAVERRRHRNLTLVLIGVMVGLVAISQVLPR